MRVTSKSIIELDNNIFELEVGDFIRILSSNLLSEDERKIYEFFDKTPEIFDNLVWDGETLDIEFHNKLVNTYTLDELIDLGVI